MKKSEPTTTIIFPFDLYHLSYRCKKCDRLLRYSSIHNKVYIVSEFGDHSEILHKNHNCFKTNDKGAKVMSNRGIK
jgi:hypothetical protein